ARYGYATVRFRVESPTPRASSSIISVRTTVQGWNSGVTRVRVEQEIELAAGESTVSFDVMIPVYGSYYNLWWDIRVDGRHDKELSVDLNHHMLASLNYAGQMDESLLILDASSPSSLAGVVDPSRSMAQTLTALAQAAQPGLID